MLGRYVCWHPSKNPDGWPVSEWERKALLSFSWPSFLSIVLTQAQPRSSSSLSTNKHILRLFAGFKTLETFQSTWHPFKLAAKKPSTNRMGFREALSISTQSVCSPRHSLSWLIYFILKGLSICITRTGWKKMWVMSVTFFVYLKWYFPPPSSPPCLLSHPPPPLFFSAGMVWVLYTACI